MLYEVWLVNHLTLVQQIHVVEQYQSYRGTVAQNFVEQTICGVVYRVGVSSIKWSVLNNNLFYYRTYVCLLLPSKIIPSLFIQRLLQ